MKKFYSIIGLIFALSFLANFVESKEALRVNLLIEGIEKTTETVEGVEIPTYTNFKITPVFVGMDNLTQYSENNTALHYVFRIQSISENKILDETLFSADFLLPESTVFLNSTQESIVLPYFPEAKYLKFFYEEKEILNFDLQGLCNSDSKCSNFENFLSCQSDCSSGGKDNLCQQIEDGACDTDCDFGDADCNSYPTATKFSPSLTTNFSALEIGRASCRERV